MPILLLLLLLLLLSQPPVETLPVNCVVSQEAIRGCSDPVTEVPIDEGQGALDDPAAAVLNAVERRQAGTLLPDQGPPDHLELRTSPHHRENPRDRKSGV